MHHGPSDFGEISWPSCIMVADGWIHLVNRPKNQPKMGENSVFWGLVTAIFSSSQNQNFGQCVTRHTYGQIDWNSTVDGKMYARGWQHYVIKADLYIKDKQSWHGTQPPLFTQPPSFSRLPLTLLPHSFSMCFSLNIIFTIILTVIFVLVWGGLYTFFYGWSFWTSLKHSKYDLHIVMMRRSHWKNSEQFELPNLVV